MAKIKNNMKAYSLTEIKKIKWGFLEENNPISLYPVMYPGWTHIIKKVGGILGRPQKSIICLHNGKTGRIYGDDKEWIGLGIYALKKIIKQPGFAIKLNNKILNLSDGLVKFCAKEIFNKNLKNLTDDALVLFYKKYEDLHGDLYCRAIFPVYLDLYRPNLTEYLIKLLGEEIRRNKINKSAKECFAVLTQVENSSKVQIEEMSLYKIAVRIKQDKRAGDLFRKSVGEIKNNYEFLNPALVKDIKRHVNKFSYLGYNFEGPAFTDEYFIRRWRELIKSKQDAAALFKKLANEKSRVNKSIKALEGELKLNFKQKQLFQITRDFIYSKDYRKMSLVESYYMIEPLLKEIGRRGGLSLGEVRNCLLTEIAPLLKSKTKPRDLDKRMKNCVFAVINGKLPGQVLSDESVSKISGFLSKNKIISSLNYFHGQVASLGRASGIVKIINQTRDLKKMKPGDILVSQMTNPDLVPAMKKAAAIITDLGGITCHAAIVSRELKKPCVIGTKIATQVLRDGDMVSVDANTGEIRRISSAK